MVQKSVAINIWGWSCLTIGIHNIFVYAIANDAALTNIGPTHYAWWRLAFRRVFRQKWFCVSWKFALVDCFECGVFKLFMQIFLRKRVVTFLHLSCEKVCEFKDAHKWIYSRKSSKEENSTVSVLCSRNVQMRLKAVAASSYMVVRELVMPKSLDEPVSSIFTPVCSV